MAPSRRAAAAILVRHGPRATLLVRSGAPIGGRGSARTERWASVPVTSVTGSSVGGSHSPLEEWLGGATRRTFGIIGCAVGTTGPAMLRAGAALLVLAAAAAGKAALARPCPGATPDDPTACP